MKQTILKTFPTLLTDGAFFKEFSLFNREDVSLTPLQAGQAYALAHSGNKAITSMVENFCGDDGTVSSVSCSTLGTVLENMFGKDWGKELDALLAEYNPIENYNMTEEGSDTKSGSDTLTDDYALKRNTKTYGTHTDTFNVGQDRVTDSIGATRTTHGTHTDTNTTQVSASDSSDWSNKLTAKMLEATPTRQMQDRIPLFTVLGRTQQLRTLTKTPTKQSTTTR